MVLQSYFWTRVVRRGLQFIVLIYLFILHRYITNSQYDQLPVGLIAQLVEYCTRITAVVGSEPVPSLNFFRLSFRNCLSCVLTTRIFLLFSLKVLPNHWLTKMFIVYPHDQNNTIFCNLSSFHKLEQWKTLTRLLKYGKSCTKKPITWLCVNGLKHTLKATKWCRCRCDD